MPPLTLMVKPASGRCNLRCRYCFYADALSHRCAPNLSGMSEATLETLLRRAFLAAEGQLTLIFQGGEPTLAVVAECGDCPCWLLCRGGCRRERAQTPDGKSRWCAGIRLFYDRRGDRLRALSRQVYGKG